MMRRFHIPGYPRGMVQSPWALLGNRRHGFPFLSPFNHGSVNLSLKKLKPWERVRGQPVDTDHFGRQLPAAHVACSQRYFAGQWTATRAHA